MDEALFKKLTAFHERLMRDDASAKAAVRQLKEKAQAGDRSAQLQFNTLAALHWEKGDTTWQKADSFYQKLVEESQDAWERLKWIQAHMGSPGDLGDRCKNAFAMVKAVHKHYRVSVWYPGAPKVGGYPMPNTHRAGIEISGAGDNPMTATLDYATANHLLGVIATARASVPNMSADGMMSADGSADGSSADGASSPIASVSHASMGPGPARIALANSPMGHLVAKANPASARTSPGFSRMAALVAARPVPHYKTGL